jgi:sugar lactone lactonase YvrE
MSMPALRLPRATAMLAAIAGCCTLCGVVYLQSGFARFHLQPAPPSRMRAAIPSPATERIPLGRARAIPPGNGALRGGRPEPVRQPDARVAGDRDREPDADNPRAAMMWRRRRMVDENGTIPPNAEMIAKEYVDAMRARQQAQSRRESEASAGLTNSSWLWLGPGNVGGRTRAIVIDPATPSTWYAGSVGGGIWKTTNSGGTWTVLNDFLANLAVSTMVMQPGTSGASAVIYAGTGEGFFNQDAIQGAGIFKSSDGGNTWTQLAATSPATTSNFLYVNRLAMSPNGAVVLAGTASGVFRSTDGGTSFQAALSGSRILDVVFHPTNNSLALASGTGSVWYSTDGGVTWTAATGLPNTSADTCDTSGAQPGRVELAYAPSSPSIVYASIDFACGSIYKSTNGGVTFALVSNPAAQFLGGQGWYDNAIWVDPTNPNTLLLGGPSLYRSTDGGVTLTQIGGYCSCGSHPDNHAIVNYPGFNGTTNTTVVVGNDGGVFSTSNVYTVGTGNNWVSQNHNYGVTQYYGVAGNATTGVIIGGTQDNGTPVYTTSGGAQGFSYMAGGDGGYAAADFQNSNYFYGEYQWLGLFRSNNGAASYSGDSIFGAGGNGCKAPPYAIVDACPNSDVNFIAPFIMDPNAPQTLLAGGLQLWRTTDARTTNTSTTGPSWASIKASRYTGSGPEYYDLISAIAIAKGNSNICWVGYNDGTVFSTANCTAASPTWTQVNTGAMPVRYITRITIDPNSSSTVYLSLGGFSSNNLWQTKNSGSTWASVSGSGAAALPPAPVYDLAVYPSNSNWLYAATQVGVFTSQDMGVSWAVPQSGPANVSVDQLAWVGSSLVAATHGRGLFTATPGVNYVATTTSLSVSPATTTFGQAAVFTATVTSGGSPVTAGTVSFSDVSTGALLAANAGLDSSGRATVTVRNVGTGVHSIQAVYSGATGLYSSNASASLTVYANPTVTSLSVVSAAAGSPGFTLSVLGSGFLSGLSTVQWNGNPRSTTFISATQLTASINTADLASAGAFNVTVTNSAPAGGTSSSAPFTVVAGCTYQISSTSFVAGPAGKTGSVGVLAPAGCSWTATSNASFLTVNSGSSGSGNGTVSYTVAASAGSTRSGSLTIAGQLFSVTQPIATGPQYVISTLAGGATTPTPAAALSTSTGAVQPAWGPAGIVADGAGNTYFASTYAIYRVDSGGTLYRIAGTSRSGYSGDGGPAVNAQLSATALARDAAGNIYAADPSNNRVRKISPNGIITTYAGTGSCCFNGDGGAATSAYLNDPQGVATDSSGNVYIADSGNERIRKVTPGGTISTVAGSGNYGFGGDGGAATAAQFQFPSAIAVDSSGNLYIGDTYNYRIRKVTGGIITTMAGTGSYGYSGDGGPAANAQIQYPYSLAVDSSGNVYVADGSTRIRMISPGGTISTVAGNGNYGFSGDGAAATSAPLTYSYGVAVDSAGSLYIADEYYDFRIRQVSNGIITTIAGNGTYFYSGDGGPAVSAVLANPTSVAVDKSGYVYIADSYNNRVRKVANGTITTIAGTSAAGFSGDGGPATNALFNFPSSVAIDTAGDLFIVDQYNGRIRMISSSGIISTVAGNGNFGFGGDGGPAINAQFEYPEGIAVDHAGNLYIADTNNHRIRKVSPGGTITTLAGTGTSGYAGDGGPATSAQLNYPESVAVDLTGNVYIADTDNSRIRKVAANGTISTVAGNGNCCYSGDGGPATSAQLAYPVSVAVDAVGNFFVADIEQRVRMVSTAGIINTVAGNGSLGYSGDGGVATSAQLNYPSGIVVDAAGNVYVADQSNEAIRLLQPTALPLAQPAFSSIALSFGNQTVGVASATQTVTLTNTGSSTLTVTSVAVSGDFSQTNNCTNLVSSGTCTVTVKFTPTTTGSRSGAIAIADSGSGSPQTIHLSGVGVSGSASAKVSLSTIYLEFGNQAINTTSGTKSITLTNSGNATLSVSSLSASGNFAQSNNCGALAASATCTMNVTFTPTTTGPSQGGLVIVDNAAGSPQTIRLFGVGTSAAVPLVSLSKVSVNFGNQTTGTTSAAQTITVTNSGNAALTITGVNTNGDFAASGCVTSLSSGASCTLSVTFTPSVTGARRGAVMLIDNATGSPQVIRLFGNGT